MPRSRHEAIGEGDPAGAPPRPEDVTDEHAEIEGSGLFDRVEVRRYIWERRCTAGQYLALLDTYSGHRLMTAVQRTRLYDDIRRRIACRQDPVVRKHYLNILHLAWRAPGV